MLRYTHKAKQGGFNMFDKGTIEKIAESIKAREYELRDMKDLHWVLREADGTLRIYCRIHWSDKPLYSGSVKACERFVAENQ